MCTSTKAMKTTPLAAMSSFSTIVERAALAPVTRPVVCPGLGRVVATSAGYRDARPVQQGRPSDPRWYGAGVPDRGGWRPDLDAWPVRLVVAFALAAANGVWLLLDRNSPSFDQASYLRLTVLYNRAVADAGPDVLFDTVRAMDPGRGPWR